MKTLKGFSIYDGKEFEGDYDYKRLSRWIKIKQNYNPSKRNGLWDYVTDSYGYHPYQDKFNPAEGLYLDYFTFNGRNYAIDQFIRIGCAFDCMGRCLGYYENGDKHYLAGYEADDYIDSLFIELDEYGENVRVYEEV